jgi:hypothetical protein
MKYKLFVTLIALLFIHCVSSANPTEKKKMYEKDYVNKYCTGQVEYILPDRTRVDCLTDEFAIEFDYARKWAESIGQSLYYSKKTGKKPAVAIIVKKPSDDKYIQRIKDINLGITIFKIKAEDYHCPN